MILETILQERVVDLIINMRNGVNITKLTSNFLSNRAITGFSTRSPEIFIRKDYANA